MRISCFQTVGTHQCIKYGAYVLAFCMLTSCGLFDSGIEWRGGPYALLWIDSPENISLVREGRDGSWSGLLDATVFAVGWDGRIAVAKQHPSGNPGVTNYYILDSRKNWKNGEVTGPLTQAEFEKKSKESPLPRFSKVLGSLQ